MRKVSREAAQAFIDGRKKTSGNTFTDGKELRLYGNLIGRKTKTGDVQLSLAGWGTVTTRERVNSVCELLGVGRPFHQRAGEQLFNSGPIDSDAFYTVDNLN